MNPYTKALTIEGWMDQIEPEHPEYEDAYGFVWGAFVPFDCWAWVQFDCSFPLLRSQTARLVLPVIKRVVVDEVARNTSFPIECASLQAGTRMPLGRVRTHVSFRMVPSTDSKMATTLRELRSRSEDAMRYVRGALLCEPYEPEGRRED